MYVGGVRITPLDLQLAGIAAAALAVVFAILYLTPIGRQMRAVADDRGPRARLRHPPRPRDGRALAAGGGGRGRSGA